MSPLGNTWPAIVTPLSQILPLIDGYGVEDVQYVWTYGALKSIKMASDMRLSQFDLIGHPAGNETAAQPQGIVAKNWTEINYYVVCYNRQHL